MDFIMPLVALVAFGAVAYFIYTRITRKRDKPPVDPWPDPPPRPRPDDPGSPERPVDGA
jgi:hypothetical protein